MYNVKGGMYTHCMVKQEANKIASTRKSKARYATHDAKKKRKPVFRTNSKQQCWATVTDKGVGMRHHLPYKCDSRINLSL